MLNLINGNRRIKERNSINVEKMKKREGMITKAKVTVIHQIREGGDLVRVGRLKNVEEVRVTHVIENQCSADLRKVQNISKFLKIISNSTISLTTYKKSGDEVHTPVWVVNIDERGFVRTSMKAGKLKRIRNNSNVIIASCTSRGKINGDKVLAKAVVIEPRNGEYKMINKKFRNKYKLMYYLIMWKNNLTVITSAVIRLSPK